MTGIGVVSPLGIGVRAFWDALVAGKSAFSPIESFAAAAYRTQTGAEIKGGPPRAAYAYALIAAREALADAKIELPRLNPARAGISLGTTSGETVKVDEHVQIRLAGDEERFAEEIFQFCPASIPARLADKLGWSGPNLMLTTACAAGNSALAWGFDHLRRGAADLMLVGGVDVFNRIVFAGFNRLLSVAPEVCAPFSFQRKGIIPGEGAGMLVLEAWDLAAARGAAVYAEVLGYGLSSDARHVTQPDSGGIARAMADCLEQSGLAPGDVDYVNAHGTGTPANDKAETAAIKSVFGARSSRVPVSSIKSMLGHGMGAASAFEAAACCLALRTGVLPPTANFSPGDPDCDLDYIPNKCRKTDPKVVLSNAFAFGGSNCVVAFARPDAGRTAPEREGSHRVVITGWSAVETADPGALAERLLPEADLRYLDDPIAYTLCGAKGALNHAGLSGVPPEELGIVADTKGEEESQFVFCKDLVTGGPDAVEPRQFPNILANAATSRAAILLGMKKTNISIGGCYPGGEGAVALAYGFLRARGKGILVAGGVDRGASMFVLETLEGARARGAAVRAEIVGCGESFAPGTAPRRDPGCLCLVNALEKFCGGKESRLEYRGRGAWGGTVAISLGRI